MKIYQIRIKLKIKKLNLMNYLFMIEIKKIIILQQDVEKKFINHVF